MIEAVSIQHLVWAAVVLYALVVLDRYLSRRLEAWRMREERRLERDAKRLEAASTEMERRVVELETSGAELRDRLEAVHQDAQALRASLAARSL